MKLTSILLLAGLACGAGLSAEEAGNEFFERKIRPVLVKHCYKCHSSKADEIQGGLNLETREGIRAGGDNGPAIVPGEVEDSFLISAIRYQEDDYQMPPDGRLPAAVVDDFVKWVEMGAPDPREHKGD